MVRLSSLVHTSADVLRVHVRVRVCVADYLRIYHRRASCVPSYELRRYTNNNALHVRVHVHVHVLYAAQFFCIRYCKRTGLQRCTFEGTKVLSYELRKYTCSLLARDMICIMTSERAIINNIALQLTVDRLTIISSSYLKVASYEGTEGMKLASY